MTNDDFKFKRKQEIHDKMMNEHRDPQNDKMNRPPGEHEHEHEHQTSTLSVYHYRSSWNGLKVISDAISDQRCTYHYSEMN